MNTDHEQWIAELERKAKALEELRAWCVVKETEAYEIWERHGDERAGWSMDAFKGFIAKIDELTGGAEMNEDREDAIRYVTGPLHLGELSDPEPELMFDLDKNGTVWISEPKRRIMPTWALVAFGFITGLGLGWIIWGVIAR